MWKDSFFLLNQSVVLFAHSNKVLQKLKRFFLRQPYQWEEMLVS